MSSLDWGSLADILGRLGASVLVGGLVGIERRIHGHWADPRTYMSVSMGAAIFAIIGRAGAVSAGHCGNGRLTPGPGGPSAHRETIRSLARR